MLPEARAAPGVAGGAEVRVVAAGRVHAVVAGALDRVGLAAVAAVVGPRPQPRRG